MVQWERGWPKVTTLCYCWEVKVDLHRKTAIVFIDSLLWTLMRLFLWCDGGKKQVGVGWVVSVWEKDMDPRVQTILLLLGNVECCLTWMGFFFYYRIKIAKHQIFLCTPGRSAHTSVTEMIFYSEKEFYFWLLNIFLRWGLLLIKSTVTFANCWLTCKQSFKPTKRWSVMYFLISVTTKVKKGEVNLPWKGPVWGQVSHCGAGLAWTSESWLPVQTLPLTRLTFGCGEAPCLLFSVSSFVKWGLGSKWFPRNPPSLKSPECAFSD